MFHVLGGGGGGWGFWVWVRHCTVVWGGCPTVPSLPLVVGAVARAQALHVLLAALLQALP